MSERIEAPKSYYVYEFSYPDLMMGLSGIIFYVGKGTHASRMDHHLQEAASGHECAKCKAIRSIWDTGLIPARRIVFETRDKVEVINEERRRILLHRSPHLTNIVIIDNTKEKIKTEPVSRRRDTPLWQKISPDKWEEYMASLGWKRRDR